MFPAPEPAIPPADDVAQTTRGHDAERDDPERVEPWGVLLLLVHLDAGPRLGRGAILCRLALSQLGVGHGVLILGYDEGDGLEQDPQQNGKMMESLD